VYRCSPPPRTPDGMSRVRPFKYRCSHSRRHDKGLPHTAPALTASPRVSPARRRHDRVVPGAERGGVDPRAGARQLCVRGRAVQVDPIKPTLKAPVNKRLKLEYDELLSRFAFKFNLRRYIVGFDGDGQRGLHLVGRCMLTLSNPSRKRLEPSV